MNCKPRDFEFIVYFGISLCMFCGMWCKIFQFESFIVNSTVVDQNTDNLIANSNNFFCLDSPKSSSKTANLTGNERQIKDGCADIYNAVQKWTKINREGTDVITEIANIRISFL